MEKTDTTKLAKAFVNRFHARELNMIFDAIEKAANTIAADIAPMDLSRDGINAIEQAFFDAIYDAIAIYDSNCK